MTNAEYLNECGSKLSAMDALLAKATERLTVGDKDAAQQAITAAHALLGPAGLALAWVAYAVIGAPAPGPIVAPPINVPTTPSDPFGVGFGSRSEFLAWADAQQQAMALDGVLVHSGFGPRADFYTQGDGRVSMGLRAPTPDVPVTPTPVDPAVPRVPGEIPYGDFSRHEFYDSPDVTTFAFVVPNPPGGVFPGPNGPLLRLSVSEYGGQPHIRAVSLSMVKGDMSGPFVSVGKEAGANIVCGADFPLGATVYINTHATEDFPAGSGKSSVSIIWPPLVYP